MSSKIVIIGAGYVAGEAGKARRALGMQGIRESDFARRASTGQPPPLTATRAKGVRPGTHPPSGSYWRNPP